MSNPTATRYILFKETPCPGCGGDGWAPEDMEGPLDFPMEDTCPMCDGQGVVRVQVAVVPEPVAEILQAQFGVMDKERKMICT